MKEKNEKSRLGKCLSVALCLAAVLGGAWACLLYTVLSQRGNALSAGVPAQEEAPVAAPGEAEPAALPEAEESAVSSEPETFPEPIALLEPAPAAPQSGSAPRSPSTPSAPRPAVPAAPRKAARQDTGKKNPDLSAYRVKAHSAEGESFLPEDTSLSAADLNAQQKGGDKKVFDGGRGLIGDIYRGGKRILDSMDAATLDATRRVLGGVARPEKAKLRPSGDGVRLNIEIPPESVRIGR